MKEIIGCICLLLGFTMAMVALYQINLELALLIIGNLLIVDGIFLIWNNKNK